VAGLIGRVATIAESVLAPGNITVIRQGQVFVPETQPPHRLKNAMQIAAKPVQRGWRLYIQDPSSTKKIDT